MCSCHSVAADRLYDVSVRCAMSNRALSKGSAHRPAVASGLAIDDKAARYPALGGVSVSCFGMDMAGRFHPTAIEVLRRLAGLARDRMVEREVRPAAILRRWQHQLQAALVRSLAVALLAACNNGR